MAINAQRFAYTAETLRGVHLATPPAGEKLENVLKPEYWAHVAATLRPHSRIEVCPEDGSWFAELFIISCGRNWANVTALRHVDISGEDVEAPDSDFEVKWRGVVHRHSIIRKSDKSVIKAEFATRADAKKWLDDYETNVIKA